jgi:DivIVA domain-containing protein
MRPGDEGAAANHEAMISRIQNARFGTSWRERTYDEKEVDDFLDEVKKTLGEGHLPDPAKVRNAKFSVTGLLWPGYVIVDVDDLLDEIERYVGGLSRNGARCGDLPPRLGSTRELTATIRRFTGGRNDRCQPFVRTKPTEEILAHATRKETS